MNAPNAKSRSVDTDPNMVKVWDKAVRGFHWSLVVCFFSAYFLAENGVREWHEYLGYAILGLIGFRILWGFIGSPYARFDSFFPRPARVFPYIKAMLHRQEPRYLGHNPAAAVMIFFLLGMCIAIGVSGYLMTTDWGFGSETLEVLHEVAVNATLIAVAIHVVAALYESRHHKENLIKAMITGIKRTD